MAQQSLETQVASLSAEDAAKLLKQHPAATVEQVLSRLPAQHAAEIARQLSFSRAQQREQAALVEQVEGSIAPLVSQPVGVITEGTTVAGALDYLVHILKETGITYLYVLNAEERLTGVVSMRDLLLAKPGQLLEEIMTPKPLCFSEVTPLRDALRIALVKHLRLYPVTDEAGKLIGLVFGWQLFERLASEINAQIGSLVGVDKEERCSTGVWQAFKMRHPWLQVNLLTAFVAAFVVGLFEDTIAQIVALAVFLPVLAGQSGNTGCQALAITLRGMTLGELNQMSLGSLLRKELLLGAINGFVVGLVAAVAMWLYAAMTDSTAPASLALVVLLAMIGACTGSGLFGVLVPVTLRKFGADPAMASSIFLTTFTDILGMGLMLLLATSVVL